MSLKRIKKVNAPAHEQSLADEEMESRSNLAVQKTVRQKKKVIEDPRLGADMTKKILNAAVEQLEEEKEVGDTTITLPLAEDDIDEGEEIVLNFETNDKESADMFNLFKAQSEDASKLMDERLVKTAQQTNKKVRQLYVQLGSLLRIYKSGKLPKAVNTLASQNIPDWLDLLYLSQPMRWSINAINAVTVLFAQSASDRRCEIFYHEILLEYIEDVLEKSKKLPQQLWKALLGAARRPKCFIRGILLPLSESNCPQKEARVVSLIVQRVKLPRDHANAFIIKICEGDITPVRTIFLANMIAKGQALAIQAIDAILNYFLRFEALPKEPKLPVSWHQALLDFVNKYGTELLFEQRDHLEILLRKHNHEKITPLIFEYLNNNPPREEFVHANVQDIPTY
ncbi:Bystin [Histomonas meleagridis]|uniref:Bystin n=1 Tax=Histomonas meleagridis TaxID=135588 RepID=UPI0035597F92|nr:Bystin [Histomonas meleagridis]KAH0802060.1 Bystin [Histomonas meleagridis]